MKLKLTTKSQIEKRPARTTAAMLLQMKITTSCPNNAKPNVGSSAFHEVVQNWFTYLSVSIF
jgi:hypothetical protein